MKKIGRQSKKEYKVEVILSGFKEKNLFLVKWMDEPVGNFFLNIQKIR
jgi:hypothetical protein